MPPTWRITLPNGDERTCERGTLESTLNSLRRLGVDEFTVEALSESPGMYVPELERPDVPDTIPEEWE